MAGKSRQRRGKYAYEDKQRKRKQIAVGTDGEEQTAPQVPKTAALRPVTSPSASTPGTKATPFATKHLHVGSELRQIGMIAGIIVTVLVVLSFVLP